jgi:hypothetical protein
METDYSGRLEDISTSIDNLTKKVEELIGVLRRMRI